MPEESIPAISEPGLGAAPPFATLTPEFIMDAVESQGYRCDCRIFALNSYENRVYQVGIEDDAPLVVKFYRPERWSDAQIDEEHLFCAELVDQELPVVAPLADAEGKTLRHFGGFRFALFPRRGGRSPELDNLPNLLILGRLLGRIHLAGASRPFTHRPRLDCETFGRQSAQLISERFIPTEYRPSYDAITGELLDVIEARFAACPSVPFLRTHADCHSGNLLWRDEGPHFVDFDDARMAPAVQDIWMLLSGDRGRQSAQLETVLEGYHQFYSFRPQELQLVEALRTLRMLHYSAWLARRWDDPAFPANFPWFNTIPYWGNHILELREQLAALQEPPLSL
jgi:Ser/Thr protein kinase RdoA (MazF antagonist)